MLVIIISQIKQNYLNKSYTLPLFYIYHAICLLSLALKLSLKVNLVPYHINCMGV